MDDKIEEGGSTTRPPLLTDSNYDYWKNRMKWYMKNQDEAIWRATQTQWTPPVATVNGVVGPKSEDEWTAAESAIYTANSKAVSIIQCDVRPSVYRIIQNLETAKESWDALQLTYEGTQSVRNSKLHLLSTRFESLTMKDDETIADFEKNLRYIANESTALGEVIPESKLVRKVLISLPERFSSKMDAISESTEFENLRLDDLMGKLRTHEMTLTMRNRDKTKTKTVAFKTDVEDSAVSTDDQDLREQVAFLTKNMGKQYRRFNRNKINDYTTPNQKTKCANTIEKQKRSLFTTWSDEETSEDNSETSDDGSIDRKLACKALTTHTTVGTPQNPKHRKRTVETATCSSTDEEDSDSDDNSDIQEKFKKILDQMKDALHINQQLSDEVQQLQEEREDFDNILGKYESEIEHLTAKLSMSETKFEEADHEIERLKGEKILDELQNRTASNILPSGVNRRQFKSERGESSKHVYRRRKIVCHYCNKPGHIRPNCYILQNDIHNFIGTRQRRQPRTRVDIVNHAQRKIWVKKEDLKCLMSKTSTKRPADWHFDSGCLQHMTGDKNILKDITYQCQGKVTYGDGNANPIIGEGSLPVSSSSKIKNVLLVKGLKHNLISIGQMCDEDCEINFNKHGCKVMNETGDIVMTGSRQTNYTYTLDGDIKCLKTSTENLIMWHKKLEHVGFRNLVELSKAGAVKGLPVLTYDSDIASGRTIHDHYATAGAAAYRLDGTYANSKSGRIRSDHGREFKNYVVTDFCEHSGIAHEFSAPITPKQNGIVERKNRSITEMARTMIHAKKLSYKLWEKPCQRLATSSIEHTFGLIRRRHHMRSGGTKNPR
ncbi:uncharacterized protein [Rutidosis leptorrhynchoides]|uniref:uncharacterized protein n=1 Tax=Rutidosis leptorrhynchoides TaxID=125765 RepID=UPI003A98FB08